MNLSPRKFRAYNLLQLRRLTLQIDRLESSLQGLKTEELTKRSRSLRYRVLAGEPDLKVLPEAFALVRELGVRTLNMRLFDVQLIGGAALHLGKIAVMQTGEGKTLTAVAPLYLASLSGKGAHLLTANDYLAQRDAESLRPLYAALGLTVGYITSESSPAERRQAYACDITYSTAKEVGFDFLRDRLRQRQQMLGIESKFSSLVGSAEESIDESVQRPFYYAIVDEADNLLIDEARTPLVVSGLGEGGLNRAPLFRWASQVVAKFSDEDYEREDAKRQINLTTSGRKLARQLAAVPEIAPFPLLEVYGQLDLALVVQHYYARDRHYVIRDGEVVIVDEFTGRLAEGRKWRTGLHQAIEAREQLEITAETEEVARVTIQHLFSKYERLAGMTGTIGNSANELKTIYGTPVIEVPTHRPPRRLAYPAIIARDDRERWLRIADEVESIYEEGRPILIGTRSIDKSQILSQILTQRGIPHEVLNAKEHAREAEIVAHAGEFRKVTVATNMAGRGTDIRLDAATLELGGLHVICSEMHDSARIDRQLIGRAGRQGDPGSYRQFLSLDDDILVQGLSAWQLRRLRKLSFVNEIPQQVARYFRLAQRRIEQRNFEGRKVLLYQENRRREIQIELGQDPYLDAIE